PAQDTGPIRGVGSHRVSPPFAHHELSIAKITVLRSPATAFFAQWLCAGVPLTDQAPRRRHRTRTYRPGTAGELIPRCHRGFRASGRPGPIHAGARQIILELSVH